MFLWGFAALLVGGGQSVAIAAEPSDVVAVDFARDIRPLLAGRCFKCHGPEKQEAGLRLDHRAAALVGGDSGAVLVAGKSGESGLFQRVSGADPDALMPPDGEGERLSTSELELVRKWIDSGLDWPAAADGTVRVSSQHWAYQPIVRPELPPVKQCEWVRNPVDRFVLARLESEGLAPAAETDRGIWLRRASLDLTGLPPALSDIEAFAADARPDAYEQAIERLLADAAYGERWARLWLDLARYADTNGYEKDDRRTMWRYRDWVIEAFASHMPFDRFTVEQIAGDMLPNATLEQRIATGFHRNTMNNTEGGTDDEEFRCSAVVDRVNTTMTVWMATTMACAQCHTHKYDPFTQREYFQLFALLNNTADADTNDLAPTIEAPTPALLAEITRMQEELAAARKILDTPTPELAASQSRWEEAVRLEQQQWLTLEPSVVSSAPGTTLSVQPDRSILASGANPAHDTYVINVRSSLAGITAFRLEAIPDDSLPDKGPGRAAGGNFVLSEFRVLTRQAGTADAPPTDVAVALKKATAQHAEAKYAVKFALDGKDDTGWGNAPRSGVANQAVFTLEKPLTLAAETTLQIVLAQQAGAEQHQLGRFRLSATIQPTPPAASEVPATILAIVNEAAASRSPAAAEELARYYRTIAPELASRRDLAAKLEREMPKPPTTPVMVELAEPRETKIHIRGSFLNQGDRVEPQTPAVFPPLDGNAPANRLALALWLVDRQNPLTARVWVNRIWEQYFGVGLVRTSEDFGARGETPTHPELLDWLAVELMEQGWDLRVVHRLIASSATYRQQSRTTPELTSRDPENRLLARGPRVRLDAEQIRDQALAVSGLLSRKMYGPSVMPPQPDGVWNMPYSSDKWQNAAGEDRYRRAVYTFWRRTAPYPLFNSFDAPSRELCVVRRPRTNTPLQALTVLNDPAFVECAQALARRVLTELPTESETAARARHMFRLCVVREPHGQELEQLVSLWSDARAQYVADPAAAAKLVATEAAATGAPPQASDGTASPVPQLDPVDWAAWTIVANVLLNLDELITKG